MNESSLMIWDIEQKMNKYLNTVKEDQDQQFVKSPMPFEAQKQERNIDIQGHSLHLG